MTVVPIGGMDEMPALGCGPAVWCGVADPGEVGDDPFLVAVLAADTDDAGAAGPDDPLPVWTELEPAPVAPVGLDDPPHAASSSTSDPSPVAAAHPLLRIMFLHFARMTRCQGSPSRPGSRWGEAETKRSRAVVATGPGTLKPSAGDD